MDQSEHMRTFFYSTQSHESKDEVCFTFQHMLSITANCNQSLSDFDDNKDFNQVINQ